MSYDLCEELIIEIFSRLPSKSLLRFRSVSKSLCACIDSPEFIRLHTLRSPKKVMIIHQICSEGEGYLKKVYTLHSQGQFPNNPGTGIPQIKFPFKRFQIVGSCNGILCVCGDGDIHLWNPSIRRELTMHDLSSWCRGYYERISTGVLGFGYDPINEDYKILRIIKPTSFIYSMKTRTMREIAYPATPYTFVKLSQCLYNGALHWVLKRYLTSACDECHCYIMKFDLSLEVFSKIELPEPNWETSVVTIINGCLGVISSDHHGNCRIWVRREYNDKTVASWSVAYTLDTNPFKVTHRVLQISPDDELLYSVNSNGVEAYNLKTKEISRLLDSTTCLIGMDVCVETLRLLDMGTS